MATDERYNLVLAFARVLFINGQATEQTVAATERLGRRLGLRVKLMPRWGELRLQSDDTSIDVVTQLAADPTGVDMDRVVSVMRLIEDVEAGRVVPEAAMEMIGAISRAPPAPAWLFTLAAAAGAVARLRGRLAPRLSSDGCVGSQSYGVAICGTGHVFCQRDRYAARRSF
jgi:uncharacterized membrane protein YjjP (DUF1212 family)